MEKTVSQETINSQSPLEFISRNKKYFLIGLVVLIIAACAGYWYWLQTPQYSLKMVRTAISNHDLTLFQKHVDVDSLVSRAIDQIIDSKMNDPNEVQDEGMNNIAKGLILTLKPQLVSAAKEEIKSFVEKGTGGNNTASEQTSSNKNGKNQSISAKKALGSAGTESAEFQGISYVNKDGKLALVGLKVFYSKLNYTGILELKMRELDGYWQIAEVNNLGSFLQKIEEVENTKIAEVNKPIVEAMNNAARIDKISATWINGGTYSRYINFPTQVTFLSEKSIIEAGALITVSDQNDKPILNFPVKSTGTSTPGKVSTINWKKEINPFIKSEETLFNTPANTLKIKVEWQYLKFADGSELKLADKLP